MQFQGLFAFIIFLPVTLTATENRSSHNPDIQIRTDLPIGSVSEKFLSVAIDTGFFRKHSTKRLLDSPNFMTMLRALKPAFIRVGGTAADRLLFDEECSSGGQLRNVDSAFLEDGESGVKTSVQNNNLSYFYLCGQEWIQLHTLVFKSGMKLLFDLNVLLRTEEGHWNEGNADKLLKFSQTNNFEVDWQLGNEPNSFQHVFGVSIPPEKLAEDFRSLSALLSKYPLYQMSNLVGPDITAPRTSGDLTMQPLPYLNNFLVHGKDIISAATWHQYYINGRNASKDMFMDISVLDILLHEIKSIKLVVEKNTNKSFPIWITETSSAWGGGAPGLSDRFVSSFMWLDKLGVAAKSNISVVVRQNLLGSGHYGLIDMTTLEPNPDYWISLLYKRIVGQISLSLKFKRRYPNVRLYAHCPTRLLKRKANNSLVVFGMNLGSTYFKGSISKSELLNIELFSFMAPENDVLSKNIILNGHLLQLSRSGRIPSMKPIKYKSKFLTIPPHSLAFFLIQGISTPACV